MRAPKPPRLYFSLRSPFSWMALRRLEERLPQAAELIEFVPFFRPDEKSEAALEEQGGAFHYTEMSKAKHLYILYDTKRLSAKFDYQMSWPLDTGAEWWELPHLAWLKARELGVHRAYYAAVAAARWERGEDICTPASLERICDEAGLDGAALVAAPDESRYRELGVQALMQAYEDDVFGIPYFKLGRQRFWGLDRLDDFLSALENTLPAAEPPGDVPAPVLDRVGAMDQDTAGGCG
ncbi:DsbA family protein [Streptomyces sp. N2-109]|uniref:2-hydroxychromene-2-carboxylate isomerase n=1 Tax=Streptomyces gossypii TaxID=2883101 RepID=A0ABT2JPE8_9ACTN|nr:DsbA family protein [Streptomyces gossypii]MCT2589593.1 DsbA family protein [Streptomyces gossypii]